jgi:hypothetical protein
MSVKLVEPKMDWKLANRRRSGRQQGFFLQEARAAAFCLHCPEDEGRRKQGSTELCTRRKRRQKSLPLAISATRPGCLGQARGLPSMS